MDKQTVLYSYNGISFSARKNWLKPLENMGNSKCILFSKRSQSEIVSYYMILVVWHSGKTKTIDTMISGCQGLVVGGMEE